MFNLKRQKKERTNWLEVLVSSLTIIIALCYEVYAYFFAPLSVYENVILSLLILIATSFMVTQLSSFSRLNKFINQYEEDKNLVQENGVIKAYESTEDSIAALQALLSSGNHSFDIVSLDQKVRTRTTSVKKHPTVNLINETVKNGKIKVRYLFLPRKDNLVRVIRRMATGNHDKNSFFSYISTNNMPPFASFFLIDDSVLLVRSPYDEGEHSEYVIIENSEIVNVFVKWFSSLWKSAQSINCVGDLEKLYVDFSEMLTPDSQAELREAMSKVKFVDE